MHSTVHNELRKLERWRISHTDCFLKNEDLVSILKFCAKNKDICTGANVHANIVKKGLVKKDQIVSTALINMYAKCGAVIEAKVLLEGLPVRNVASWNALITAYMQQKNGNEALKCFEQMQREGILPNATTLMYILRACGSIGALDIGENIHSGIIKQGLLCESVSLGNALVAMYAKCGALAKAKEVLEELPVRNVVTWSALIAGYANGVHGIKSLNSVRQMQCEGLCPNAVTFISILKACGSIGVLDKGKDIHAEIVKEGLLSENAVLGGALVDMYVKCGALAKAKKVLEGLPVRNAASWSALIAGYVQGEYGKEALWCFERMQLEGLHPDSVTYICILKACGLIGALDKGENIHCEIVRQGLLNGNVALGGALVDMYAKCGALVKAKEALDGLPARDVVSWSALIAGYAHEEYGKEALSCFEQMQCEGHFPDQAIFICLLKACGSIGALDKVNTLHSEIVKQGLMGENLVIGNALVDAYAKCCALTKAKEVLDELPVHDGVTWSALIAGYAQGQCAEEAVSCFEQMQEEGFLPNSVTFISVLKACGNIRALDKGENIYLEIMRLRLLGGNVLLGNALVDMYVNCGAFLRAKEVLEQLFVRDVVSWNVLISGYVKEDCFKEALDCFEDMQCEGFFPDAVTITSILKACGEIGALDKGKKMHFEIVEQGLLDGDAVLGGALVGMYAKCGALAKAKEVLLGLSTRNVVSWNALIVGYAQGEGAKEALDCFEQMQHEGLWPDEITFLCVLSACSHWGLLDEGQKFFTKMTNGHGIIPNSDHTSCMIYLLGCVGRVDEATAIIQKMPFTDAQAWLALLSACQKWGNSKLAKLAFDRAVQSAVAASVYTKNVLLLGDFNLDMALARLNHVNGL